MKKISIGFILVLMLLVACVPVSEQETSADDGANYKYLIIDDMPCLYFSGYKKGSVSCDWSKWNGSTDYNVKELE